MHQISILKDHVTLKTGVMMLKIHNVLLYFTIMFYCIFDRINAALVSIKGFFQKNKIL